MKRYTTNQPATYGLYVSARPLDVQLIGADGETLRGREGASYRRLPMWAVVALGPALGGVFVMAFPLLVIAAVLGTLATLAVRAVTTRHAYVAQSTWQPAVSFFDARAEGPDAAPKAPESADGVADLQAEVARRAEGEKREL